MLEVLAYLRSNGFKTYIVSGGGVEFMRPSPSGSTASRRSRSSAARAQAGVSDRRPDGKPCLLRAAKIDFVDDGPGKPVGIPADRPAAHRSPSATPTATSQMLQWTTRWSGPRFGLLVHHTDAEREWAYDRDSHIGRLDKALDEAPARGWMVVDMKQDWKRIYPFEK